MSASVLRPDTFAVCVVAASQGGLQAHRELLGSLQAGLGLPIVVLQHRRPGSDVLLELMRRWSPLPVQVPAAGERLRPDVVHLCPADRQARFDGLGALRLDPLEHGRPAADPLLTSAAQAYGSGVLAVVLSGRLDDGAAGVRAVRQAGGRVLVQHPGTAECSSMPQAALATGCADMCLPPRSLGHAIGAFCAVAGSAELFSTSPSPWARPLVVNHL